ncbi:WD40-repeat-containing domain protein [Mycena galopus ATCC 62051]|nr:WD40-repeat-containing domain protein [Mycena galopus ATCC 62051]
MSSASTTAPHQTPKVACYRLCGALRGHHGAVACLKATEDGRFLASGGPDGVQLWDLQAMRPLQRPAGAGDRGATTALLWIRREDEPGEILFYRTQSGLVVCWRQLPNCPLNPTAVFSVEIPDFLPISIAFKPATGQYRDVIIFGLHDGRILTLNGQTGEINHTCEVRGKIGSADYNDRTGAFCIDDAFQGAALYKSDSETRVHTFAVKLTQPNVLPRKVCFADNFGSVVSGSDHGLVYVFDRRTEEVTDTLFVDPADWVQTVTATQVDGVSTIIAGRSRDRGGDNTILVWKKKGGAGASLGLMRIAEVVILAAALVVLYMSIRSKTVPGVVAQVELQRGKHAEEEERGGIKEQGRRAPVSIGGTRWQASRTQREPDLGGEPDLMGGSRFGNDQTSCSQTTPPPLPSITSY